MPRAKVYTDDETTATPGDSAAQNSNGESGWEPEGPATPIGLAPHKGKHTYRDGVCIKCGQSQSDVQSRQQTRGTGTPRSSNSLSIEMIASMAWLGTGIGLENIQPSWPVVGVLGKPVERPDGSIGASPAKASGRVMQLEASIAGKRIDRAIKGTVVAKFLNAVLNMTGPWAELIPLFLPPLIIGGVAAWPEITERFPFLKGLMVATMLPVLTEAAKLAEQQSALMGNLESVSQENIAKAVNVIQSILSDDSSTTA